MTRLSIDKTFATLLCAAAIGSMSIHPRARAAAVFPPEHRAPQAVLATPASTPAGPVAAPWYRTTAPRVELRLDRTLVDMPPETAAPWYRATN